MASNKEGSLAEKINFGGKNKKKKKDKKKSIISKLLGM